MSATIQLDEEPGQTLVFRLQNITSGATVGESSYSFTEVASSGGNYQDAVNTGTGSDTVADGIYRIIWWDTSISDANFLGSSRVRVVDGETHQVGSVMDTASGKINRTKVSASETSLVETLS